LSEVAGIEYYRGVAAREKIDLRLYERVERVDGSAGKFSLTTSRGTQRARHVIVAVGFYDVPNRLHVPGEDLPKVMHYYREPFGFVGQQVAVIGARNSAAKAALDCYRHGAKVTMVVRGRKIADSVKYWIKPDLQNRIKDGSIVAYFDTVVEEILERSLKLRSPDGPIDTDNDFVLAMTGYQPDFGFLESLGITFADDAWRTPVYDARTFETARPGIHLAGTVCGGLRTNRWFIETPSRLLRFTGKRRSRAPSPVELPCVSNCKCRADPAIGQCCAVREICPTLTRVKEMLLSLLHLAVLTAKLSRPCGDGGESALRVSTR
jgi:thioredoxin reductase (NADPH)